MVFTRQQEDHGDNAKIMNEVNSLSADSRHCCQKPRVKCELPRCKTYGQVTKLKGKDVGPQHAARASLCLSMMMRVEHHSSSYLVFYHCIVI